MSSPLPNFKQFAKSPFIYFSLDIFEVLIYNVCNNIKIQGRLEKMSFEDILGRVKCPVCGRVHDSLVKTVVSESGAINNLPDLVKEYGADKVFILADKNTYAVAGERAESLLLSNGITVSKCVFTEDTVTPDEHFLGAAVMRFDPSADLVIGVGSGVINDLGKIVAKVSGKPYFIVATAPSMDGYASALSSMERDGLKCSISSKCPDAVIGDTDIMKDAPIHMLRAGLGDMIAKYISICEWRIAELICGEYYCEHIASTVRSALKKCVDNAGGLLRRDPEAVRAVFEGLVLGGISMNYATISRPASGMEHYISHVWDMRGLEFGTPVDLHGIQCAIGALTVARKYAYLKANVTPDKEKALAHANAFDYSEYADRLRALIGKGAEAMIALEAKEGKYDTVAHAARLDKIIGNWDAILDIVNAEVPAPEYIEELLRTIGAPISPEDIGINSEIMPTVLRATGDIRDKYVLSRLAWDLGIESELFGEI